MHVKVLLLGDFYLLPFIVLVLALQHWISELTKAWKTWKGALQRWLEVVSSYILVENLNYSTKVNCFNAMEKVNGLLQHSCFNAMEVVSSYILVFSRVN